MLRVAEREGRVCDLNQDTTRTRVIVVPRLSVDKRVVFDKHDAFLVAMRVLYRKAIKFWVVAKTSVKVNNSACLHPDDITLRDVPIQEFSHLPPSMPPLT